MPTKSEIFDKVMGFIDMGIAMGFYTDEEVKELQNLERLYYIQSEEVPCDSSLKIKDEDRKEASAEYDEFETGKFSYDEFAANP